MRSLVEGGPKLSLSLGSPTAIAPVPEGKPQRVRLRDLPTPSEVRAEAERCFQKYGWGGKKNRRELEERLKLQFYYGGEAVYVLRTPEGPVVIPIEEHYKGTPDLRPLTVRGVT